MPAAPSLLKGTLDVLVLKALARGPMHGFEITVWIEEHSEGFLAVDDGALYQALHRMEARGLVGAEWGITDNNRRARYYSMTSEGRKYLRRAAADLVRYAHAVVAILAEGR
jgi:transcriptional regulator